MISSHEESIQAIETPVVGRNGGERDYRIQCWAYIPCSSPWVFEFSKFEEAKKAKDVANLKPVQLPFTYVNPLVDIPTSSSDVSDICLANNHPAVRQMKNTENEKLLIDHIFQNSVLQFDEPCLDFHYQDYMGKLEEFRVKLNTVKSIVRPGCSQEVLNLALSSMSSLSKILSAMPSRTKLHASL